MTSHVRAASTPRTARLRAPCDDTIGRGLWKLLWLPPSLPLLRERRSLRRPDRAIVHQAARLLRLAPRSEGDLRDAAATTPSAGSSKLMASSLPVPTTNTATDLTEHSSSASEEDSASRMTVLASSCPSWSCRPRRPDSPSADRAASRWRRGHPCAVERVAHALVAIEHRDHFTRIGRRPGRSTNAGTGRRRCSSTTPPTLTPR